MHSSINADQLLRELALSIARNSVGAMRPTHEIVAGEGLTQTEYDAIAANPQFQRYVDMYTKELKDSGFSFSAKARVLAEDLLPTLYHMAKDMDTPAAVRRQAITDIVEWAELKPKTNAIAPSGPGFSITINIPSTANTPQQTLILEAETPKIDDFSSKMLEDDSFEALTGDFELPIAEKVQKAPLFLLEDDDYEYGGEDYT
jgi:hypothetical protein